MKKAIIIALKIIITTTVATTTTAARTNRTTTIATTRRIMATAMTILPVMIEIKAEKYEMQFGFESFKKSSISHFHFIDVLEPIYSVLKQFVLYSTVNTLPDNCSHECE